jgi:hypothetical protein
MNTSYGTPCAGSRAIRDDVPGALTANPSLLDIIAGPSRKCSTVTVMARPGFGSSNDFLAQRNQRQPHRTPPRAPTGFHWAGHIDGH